MSLSQFARVEEISKYLLCWQINFVMLSKLRINQIKKWDSKEKDFFLIVARDRY